MELIVFIRFLEQDSAVNLIADIKITHVAVTNLLTLFYIQNVCFSLVVEAIELKQIPSS